MDPALKKAFANIFKVAEILICLQHVSERDSEKLKDLGASHSNQRSILTDIYGCKVNSYMEQGLADSSDEDDFQARLESLHDVWEEKVKGFWDWFVKKRASLFKEQVVGAALDRLELNERFTTNRLENLHKVQKGYCNEGKCKGDVVAVMLQLQRWIEFYAFEADRAFTGQGKFRLAPGYENFKNVRYQYWDSERKTQHKEAFFRFTPLEADTYRRPTYAGRKKPTPTKRKRGDEEVQLFEDRIQHYLDADAFVHNDHNAGTISVATNTTRSVAASAASSDAARAESSVDQSIAESDRNVSDTDRSESDEDLSFLDPFRTPLKKYELVHRADRKNCPKLVVRCQDCRVKFDERDIVVIKTTGLRERTCNDGKTASKNGNVYLHNLMKCLKGHDQNFSYTKVVVLKTTFQKLSKKARATVIKQKMKLEK